MSKRNMRIVPITIAIFLVVFSVGALATAAASPPDNYEGTVSILIADDFDHRRADTHYLLREQRSQELFELKLTADQAKRIRPGQTLRVRGRREGKVLSADIDQAAIAVLAESATMVEPVNTRHVI